MPVEEPNDLKFPLLMFDKNRKNKRIIAINNQEGINLIYNVFTNSYSIDNSEFIIYDINDYKPLKWSIQISNIQLDIIDNCFYKNNHSVQIKD